jgi:putative Holliday junction resolvase
MRYLGIDYGAKRIGLAVSSERIAFPRDVIENNAQVFTRLNEIIEKERIAKIVIGDTRTFGGGSNPITRDLDAFVEKLKAESGLPVQLVWEAGSSVEASRFAPEGRSKDDSAAAIILQRYLDMRTDALDSEHA